MSRIGRRFEALRAQSRKGLVAYLMAGDPDAAATVPAMHALVRGGADLIELGMPFSDPEAEGLVIQLAAERALAAGMTLRGVLDVLAGFRETDSDTPVVLMGYLNPVEHMGSEAFAEAAAEAGADGVLLVNLPPEEASGLRDALAARDMDVVFMLTPTTTPERARMIGQAGSGFVYYVSVKGVTGAGHLDVDDVRERLERLRSAIDQPLVVGFGVRDGRTAQSLAPLADGIAVGTVLVAAMAERASAPETIPDALYALASELRRGVDGAP